MDSAKIKTALEEAIETLFANQPNVFEFTPETRETEWNLVHHLSWEIHKFFPEYDCDVDVTKPGYGKKRPDIIFHKKGTHKNNFLVIEVKKNGTPKGIRTDVEKIKLDWFRKPLNYQFGAVINITEHKAYEVRVFENGV